MSVDSDRKIVNDLGLEAGDYFKIEPNGKIYHVTANHLSKNQLCIITLQDCYSIEDFIRYRNPKKENIVITTKSKLAELGILERSYNRLKKYEKQGE